MRVSSKALYLESCREFNLANDYFNESKKALRRATALITTEDKVQEELSKAGMENTEGSKVYMTVRELTDWSFFNTKLGRHHRRRAARFLRQYHRAARREARFGK